MNFQGLGQVDSPKLLLDVGFTAARKKADNERAKKHTDSTKKARAVESMRIRTSSEVIIKRLNTIVLAFPNIDDLDPFYNELIKSTIDYVLLKKAFGALVWAQQQLRKFSEMYTLRVHRSGSVKDMGAIRREYYGRISSVINQIEKQLKFLEESRKIMRSYPSIKTKMPTIAIAGYPNVGKTSLLRTLTTADPKIASYPFTTQQLMIGYAKHDDQKFQFIDTPGLLDRPLSQRNKIEKQSILALKHVTTKILFLIDPSESCGYPITKQLTLLNQIKKDFKLPVVVILTKSDLDAVKEVKTPDKQFTISIEKKQGIKELKEYLFN